jgi:hypothetical protein
MRNDEANSSDIEAAADAFGRDLIEAVTHGWALLGDADPGRVELRPPGLLCYDPNLAPSERAPLVRALIAALPPGPLYPELRNETHERELPGFSMATALTASGRR